MFGLRHALPIQLEYEFRMSGLKERLRHRLVTGDARVRPDIKIPEVAHPRRDAIRVGVIGPCMRTQPAFCRPMATFAGNRFADLKPRTAEGYWINITNEVVVGYGRRFRRHVVERCMAGSAAIVHRRVLDPKRVGDLFGAGRRESCKGPLRMKIAQGPDERLVLVLARTTVTA